MRSLIMDFHAKCFLRVAHELLRYHWKYEEHSPTLRPPITSYLANHWIKGLGTRKPHKYRGFGERACMVNWAGRLARKDTRLQCPQQSQYCERVCRSPTSLGHPSWSSAMVRFIPAS